MKRNRTKLETFFWPLLYIQPAAPQCSWYMDTWVTVCQFPHLCCIQGFLFKCLGVIMRKVSQRQFIQKMLDSMFSTIKHSNQAEREVCALQTFIQCETLHRRELAVVYISVGLCYWCRLLCSISLGPCCEQTRAGHKRRNGSKIKGLLRILKGNLLAGMLQNWLPALHTRSWSLNVQ